MKIPKVYSVVSGIVIVCIVLVYFVSSRAPQNSAVQIERVVKVETTQDVTVIETPIVPEVIQDTSVNKESLAVAETPPNEWVLLKGDGFSFKYPNTFLYEEGSIGPGTFYLESNSDDEEHTIYVEILPKALDPKHIEGLYGTVEDFDTVMVGTQVGYGYLEGDAGWGSYRVVTPLGERTLRIMFGGSGEDAHPFYENTQLQNKILATFLFE